MSFDSFKNAFCGPFFRGWATIPPERFVVVDQEARERMPQIVKSDVLQTMPFEESVEVVCYIARSK